MTLSLARSARRLAASRGLRGAADGVGPGPLGGGRSRRAAGAARPAPRADAPRRASTATSASAGSTCATSRACRSTRTRSPARATRASSSSALEDVWVIADSRYTIAVRREAPDTTLYEADVSWPTLWADLLATAGVKRVAIEAMTIPHITWERLQAAAPDVELVADRGLGRGGSPAEGASRARAGRRRVRHRRSRARLAPAVDPARRDREGARARPRVADPDERRGSARVRRRVPRRRRGGAAPRLARRPPGLSGCGAAVRLRRPGGGLPERHDPDAVRRGADRARRRGCTAWSRGPRRSCSRRWTRRSPRRNRAPSCPTAAATTSWRATSSTPTAAGRPMATVWATASASPCTSCPASASAARDAAASPDGLLGRTRDLPRGRDRCADRGPRRHRRRRGHDHRVTLFPRDEVVVGV